MDAVVGKRPCPGLVRHAWMRDGALMRWRIPGGELSSQVMRDALEIADRFGNGLVDFSSRCNLQIRGLPRAKTPAFIRRVSTITGGFTSETDRFRNLLVDPYSGLDVSEIYNFLPSVNRLTEAFSHAAVAASLSPKSSLILDGGGKMYVARIRSTFSILATGTPQTPLGVPCIARDPLPFRFNLKDSARVISTLLPLAALWRKVRYGMLSHLLLELRKYRVNIEMTENVFLPQRAHRILSELPACEHNHSTASAWLPAGPVNTDILRQIAALAERFGCRIRIAPAHRLILVGKRTSDLKPVQHSLDQMCGPVHRAGNVRTTACIGAVGCARTGLDTIRMAHSLAEICYQTKKALSDDAISTGRKHVHIVGCHRRCGYTGAESELVIANGKHLPIVLKRPTTSLPGQVELQPISRADHWLVAATRQAACDAQSRRAMYS